MNELSKIRVLHLRDSPWVCGPGRTIIETGVHLDANRFDYFIGAFVEKSGKANPFVTESGRRQLKVFSVEESGTFDPRIISLILRLIDENHINLLHTHEVRSNLVGLICAKLRKIPIVTTVHGWISNSIRGRLYTAIDRNCLRFFDHVIPVSEKLKTNILDAGVPKKRITVLHNALVMTNFVPDPIDISFRQELGIDKNTVLIANIGRLSPEKGQVDFLHTARKVIQHHQNIMFVLIGIGPDQNKLEKMVKDLNLGKWVSFAGFRNDMTSIYNSLDVVIQTSYSEGLPNVILEALLMKVPVIATDVGGTAEIVKNGVTGILVQPGIPEEVAAHILRFIDNRDHHEQMAMAGNLIVESEFNFEKRTERLSELYQKIMEHWNREVVKTN